LSTTTDLRTINSKLLALIALGALASSACGGWWQSSRTHTEAAPPAPPPAALSPAALSFDDGGDEPAIRSLEEKVKADPRDYIAYNKLAGYYLGRLRETGDQTYIERAASAARSSLRAAPENVNAGGLTALAQAEFASHHFEATRRHAQRLIEMDPRKSYPHRLLGDALMELGDYERAAEAFAKAERLEQFPTAATETRLARLAMLRGEDDAARERLTRALALATQEVPASRETVAWCLWQLGEAAFSVGDYEGAERRQREALTIFPDYYRSLASLGRARAALGDIGGAIELYERAVRVLPDITFIAALGDLYRVAGREREATAQYEMAERAVTKGDHHLRNLAIFYADHDLKPARAYAIAAHEYAERQDIYGADALAWAALKAGKIEEAREKSREALRLGTRDARLLYHAGMIARAAGDRDSAREHLRRALEISPQFDPLHADIARKALAELSA
jgi:tetratricopeptide (TPR) repeat protein